MVLRGRKAEAQSFHLEEFVKIIFTVMVIVLIFIPVGIKIYSIYFGVDKDTGNNFDALADAIDLMLQRGDPFEYTKIMINIKEPYNIRGFAGVLDNSGKLIDNNAPSKCRNNRPCICLYKEDKVRKCRVFEPKAGIIYFSKEAYLLKGRMKDITDAHQTPKNIPDYYGREFDMIYYPLTFRFTFEKELFDEVYVEKVLVDDIAYIMIGIDLRQEVIDRRIKFLSLCPEETSDDECKDKRRNSVIEGGFCLFNTDSNKCSFGEGEACEIGKIITKPCICADDAGAEFVDPDEGYEFTIGKGTFHHNGDLYCNKRQDGLMTVAPFSCNNICGCQHFCMFEGDEKCSEFEKSFCSTFDICGIEGSCEPKKKGCFAIAYDTDKYSGLLKDWESDCNRLSKDPFSPVSSLAK